MDKHKKTSIIVKQPGSVEEINTADFTWLDRKTRVAFVLSELVTREGLPIVLSSRPNKNEHDTGEMSPEDVLYFKHNESSQNRRVFNLVSRDSITLLDPNGYETEVNVELHISDILLQSVGQTAAHDNVTPIEQIAA